MNHYGLHYSGVHGPFYLDPASVHYTYQRSCSNMLDSYHFELSSAWTSDTAFWYRLAFGIHPTTKVESAIFHKHLFEVKGREVGWTYPDLVSLVMTSVLAIIEYSSTWWHGLNGVGVDDNLFISFLPHISMAQQTMPQAAYKINIQNK